MILAGLLTRLAAVPMIIDMLGALLITKLPIFWGHAPLFRGEHGWWDYSSTNPASTWPSCAEVSSCFWSGPAGTHWMPT